MGFITDGDDLRDDRPILGRSTLGKHDFHDNSQLMDDLVAALPEVREAAAPVRWETADLPIVIGHRGGRIGAPENTLLALDIAAACCRALEFDVQRTLDGHLVLMHDTTTTRTTGTTSTVAAQTLVGLRLQDAGAILPGPGNEFSPQVIPTFDEVLRHYGRTHLLLPEVKDQRDSTATLMAQAIVRHGLIHSVMVQSFSSSNLTAIQAVDDRIRTALTSSSQVAPATAAAAGYWAVVVDENVVDAAYVASMDAVGVRVFAFNVNDYTRAVEQNANGSHGLIVDDPSYISGLWERSTPTGTWTVEVPSAYIAGGGWMSLSHLTDDATAVSSGYVTFTGYSGLGDSTTSWIQVPLRPAATPATQTLTFGLKVVDATATTSRWMGVRFCWSTDDDSDYNGGSATNGYLFAYRRNGNVEVTRVDGGADTQIGSETGWTALSATDEFTLVVEMTATAITISVDGTSDSITVNDATYRGGLVSVIGSGVVPGVGEVVLTY